MFVSPGAEIEEARLLKQGWAERSTTSAFGLLVSESIEPGVQIRDERSLS
jgi:hypothetical protein